MANPSFLPNEIIFSLFQGLPRSFQKEIFSLPLRWVQRDHFVFQEGMNSQEIFGILSGRIEISYGPSEPAQKTLVFLSPGEIFGEFSYLTGRPRSASARATEDSQILEFSSHWMNQKEEAFPQLQKRLRELYRDRVLFNILKCNSLFQVLSQKEIQELSKKLIFRTFSEGQALCKEGERKEDLFVIKKGQVEIFKKKGGSQLLLGVQGPGDIIGEMSFISGMPRNATVLAKGLVETLVLSSQESKTIILESPSFLQRIRELIQNRAAQTRALVEQVADEIIGENWEDIHSKSFLQVKTLGVQLRVVQGEKQTKILLTQISSHRWKGEVLSSFPFSLRDEVQLFLFLEGIKGVENLRSLSPLPATVIDLDEKEITFSFSNEGQLSLVLGQITTTLAKAKVRLLVYPEYEISENQILVVMIGKEREVQVPLKKISQTHIKIGPQPKIELGTLLPIRLVQNQKEIVRTKVLILERGENWDECQFEYETPEERSKIEALIKSIAESLGYGVFQALKFPSSLETPSSVPTLQKIFSTDQEFIKTYIGSIESGTFFLPVETSLSSGSIVKVQFQVGKAKSLKKFESRAKVLTCDPNMATLELDPSDRRIFEKMKDLSQEIFQKAEQKAWEKRKQELAGPLRLMTSQFKETFQKPLMVVFVLLAILGGGWMEFQARKNKEIFGSNEQPLVFQTLKGKRKLQAGEIQSLKFLPRENSFEVRTSKEIFVLPLVQKIKLNGFQRQSLERLLVLSDEN